MVAALTTETPQVMRSTHHGSQVRELLAVYQEILDTVDDLPLVPMVLRKHRGRLHYLPRAKWPVRYFVVRHVRRTLADLSRCHGARAALGQAENGEQQDREAVRDFQQSLPPDRQKIYFFLLIAAMVVVLQRTVGAVAAFVLSFTSVDGAKDVVPHVKDDADKVVQALTANPSAATEALEKVFSGGGRECGVLILAVALSAYAVLRLLVPGFRLKRLLFNLAPEPDRAHRSAVARWSVSQATGTYERERRVFAELGARPAREFPFDLAVSALAVVFPAVWSVLIFWMGFGPKAASHTAEFSIFCLLALYVLIPTLMRIGWLWRTQRRRQLGRVRLYMPFEVRIRSGRAIAKIEDPIGLRLHIFLAYLLLLGISTLITFTDPLSHPPPVTDYLEVVTVFLLVYLPWWYRIRRELRNLDLSYGSQKPSSRPVVRLLKILTGCLIVPLPFMAVFRTSRHIQRSQARSGQRVTILSPWILAPGLLFPPALFAYLQHELNKIWAVESEPLDPWPNDTSREANGSTGTLPWLKAKRPNHRTGRCVPPLGDDFGPCVDHPVSQVKPLRNHAKKGQGGRGMAIAGLVPSGLWVLLLVACIAVYLVFVRGTVASTAVKVGDCLKEIPGDTKVFTVNTVGCDETHAGEVYAVLMMPEGDYPGQTAIDEYQNKCKPELATYAPDAMTDDSVQMYVLYPTPETWEQGDRAVTCIATLDPQRTGSIKG